MLRDPESGLFYVWRRDAEGTAYRDFTIGGQVDDRWDIDEATGEIVRVRDKASPQVLDFDAVPDRWVEEEAGDVVILSRWRPADEDDIDDDPAPHPAVNGHRPIGRVTLRIGQGPPSTTPGCKSSQAKGGKS